PVPRSPAVRAAVVRPFGFFLFAFVVVDAQLAPASPSGGPACVRLARFQVIGAELLELATGARFVPAQLGSDLQVHLAGFVPVDRKGSLSRRVLVRLLADRVCTLAGRSFAGRSCLVGLFLCLL